MAEMVDVIVGTVGKPHGLRGEVTVNCQTDEPERRFAPGQQVRADGQTLTVMSSRWQQGTLLIGFAGLLDRTSAEALRGRSLWAHVPADESPVDEDEYYDRQLIGLDVLDHTGRTVGRVVSVAHRPAQDHLVVDVAGDERSIPFVTALVPRVDLAAGQVHLANVPGLLDEAEQA